MVTVFIKEAKMFKKHAGIFVILSLMFLPRLCLAGAWDTKKGLDKITLDVELVCLGCSLKKMSGANAQCNLYTLHDIGIRLGDGTLWSIVNNQKGHDIIRAHDLVGEKKATVTGWLYPAANHIEIDSIKVQGISADKIAKAAWEEDRKIAKALSNREVGKPPVHSSEEKH
jgi:hypothetical protein